MLSIRFRALLILTGSIATGMLAGPEGAKAQGSAALLSIPARNWAADASAEEIALIEHPGSYLRYRFHTVDERGNRVRDVIESRDGSVARLIMKDGRALTAEEDKAEQDRLRELLESPANYAKHVKSDNSSKKTGVEMVKLLPDAMLYSYVPGQPQTGKSGADHLEVVIDFKPNPAFSAPTLASEALTGLSGRAWIDAKSHRLVRMEGSVFQGVNFGFGMLAHIYPGGTWTLEQGPAAGERWALTQFTDKVTVRALMVKTMKVHTIVDVYDFKNVDPMSYQEAIGVLLATPLPAK